MSENETTWSEYSKSKMEIISSYNDNEIINVLNYIKDSDNLKALQAILNLYVPIKLQNSRNNAIKYGIDTKQAFIDGLKGCPKDVVKGKIEAFKRETETRYTFIYRLYLEELFGDIQELEDFSVEDILGEDAIDLFITINKKKHCPKEYIENWYKYSPYVDKNEEIEKKIQNLTYTLADAEKQKKAEEFENLKQDLKNQNDINNELNKKIKTLEEQLNEKGKENEELKQINDENEDKLTNYESDCLELETKCERQKEKIEELENKNKDLEWEYNNFLKTNKKTFSGDIEKMKSNLESKISEKETQIVILQERINNLEKFNEKVTRLEIENEKLKRREVVMKKELKTTILNDRDFQKKFKRIILDDKPLCEFIVKNIPDLKAGVEQEVASRREQREIDREQKNITAINKYKTSIVIDKVEIDYDKLEEKYNKFCTDNRIPTIPNLWKRIKDETFFIFNDDSIVKLLNNGNLDIKIETILTDSKWYSIEDWFGKFQDGKFNPAKTDILNFYIKRKENPNQLGILVFNDFNKIPTEVYVEKFIKDIIANGYINIASPDTEEFMTIEQLSNLKYFFIKRQDEDTSFKIPKDLEKYELKEEE